MLFAVSAEIVLFIGLKAGLFIVNYGSEMNIQNSGYGLMSHN